MNANREDYLLAIYRLSKEKGYTNNIGIARALDLTRASVSEMVRKLVDENCIQLDGHRISLTPAGQKKAENTISTHRLWEVFLMEHLHLTKEEAHDQADLLEHVTFEPLSEALNKYLNYPTACPTGNPIYVNLDDE